jgi:glutaredoxin
LAIFSRPGCSQCETVKMLMDKHDIKYDYVEEVSPQPDKEYPIIYLNGSEYQYEVFLKKFKEGEIGK